MTRPPPPRRIGPPPLPPLRSRRIAGHGANLLLFLAVVEALVIVWAGSDVLPVSREVRNGVVVGGLVVTLVDAVVTAAATVLYAWQVHRGR